MSLQELKYSPIIYLKEANFTRRPLSLPIGCPDWFACLLVEAFRRLISSKARWREATYKEK